MLLMPPASIAWVVSPLLTASTTTAPTTTIFTIAEPDRRAMPPRPNVLLEVLERRQPAELEFHALERRRPAELTEDRDRGGDRRADHHGGSAGHAAAHRGAGQPRGGAAIGRERGVARQRQQCGARHAGARHQGDHATREGRGRHHIPRQRDLAALPEVLHPLGCRLLCALRVGHEGRICNRRAVANVWRSLQIAPRHRHRVGSVDDLFRASKRRPQRGRCR